MRSYGIAVISLLILLPKIACADCVSSGFKGGLNIAKFIGTDAGENRKKIGLVLGYFVNVRTMLFSVQPEIIYSQKGAVYDVGNSIRENHDYLEIPVLLKFPLASNGKPHIYFGPSFAALLKANLEVNRLEISENISEFVKKTDVSMVFGIEVKATDKLSVESRYTMGLSTFDASPYNFDVKNSTFSILLDYCIKQPKPPNGN